jgi:hypothetical protein
MRPSSLMDIPAVTAATAEMEVMAQTGTRASLQKAAFLIARPDLDGVVAEGTLGQEDIQGMGAMAATPRVCICL